MHAASRRSALAYQKGVHALVRRLGPAAAPGVSREWRPPMEVGTWRALFCEWAGVVGEIDECAVYERVQRERGGLSLTLLRGGAPAAFVKLILGVTPTPGNEGLALRRIEEAAPRTFRAPRLLQAGSVAGWSYLVLTPLTWGIHSPALRVEIGAVAAEIEGALAGLDKPAGVSAHWRPMHGDLAPWNLRVVTGQEKPVLYDWEHAGWGPPRADEVHYRATRAVLLGRADPSLRDPRLEEARRYWMSQISARRNGSRRDRRLAALLRKRLEGR